MDTCRLGNNSVALLHTSKKYPSDEVVVNGMTLFVGREDNSEVYLTKDEWIKLRNFLNQIKE